MDCYFRNSFFAGLNSAAGRELPPSIVSLLALAGAGQRPPGQHRAQWPRRHYKSPMTAQGKGPGTPQPQRGFRATGGGATRGNAISASQAQNELANVAVEKLEFKGFLPGNKEVKFIGKRTLLT